MKLYPNELFHIYNRGNNRQTLFFDRDNYLYFLEKVKEYVKPHSEIIAWCLMPNHFHFLIYIPPDKDSKDLSKGIQIILRSYTRAINKQKNRTGSLFTQNTCSKVLVDNSVVQPNRYTTTCFHYIHQNPMKAGLVKNMEDWEFSSFKDYIGLRKGKLINRELANTFINISEDRQQFYEDAYRVINESLLDKIF